jgi:hypothetical protein
LEFEVGDNVYLRVSPMKGVKRFGMKGKLAPRYIGPFPLLEKCGPVVYKLELPPSLARIHDIFHVSQLKKCLKAPVDVVLPEVTQLKADLTHPENPINIFVRRIVSWGARPLSSSRYNGVTIQKKKLHGKARTSSILAIQSLCNHRGKHAIVHCSCYDLSPFTHFST